MLNLQPSILSICDDADLQFTRELVLRSEGYSVVSLQSDHVESEPQLGIFDICILCRTVETGRVLEIAALLRRANPCIRILRIDPFEILAADEQALPHDAQALPHGSINSPSALLGAVRSLCAPQLQWRM